MKRTIPLLLALAAATTGCTMYDDGLGSARYNGSTYIGGGYGGGFGDAYGYGSGWYDGFWYPGSGVWIYDQGGRRQRWRDRDRDHWSRHRDERPGTGRPPPHGWQGRPGRGDGVNGRPPRWNGTPGTGRPDARPPLRPDDNRPRWNGNGGRGGRPDGVRPNRPTGGGEARPTVRERPAPSGRPREVNRNERPQ
jgi:hypothetical protein